MSGHKNVKSRNGCPVCGSPTCQCGESCRCTDEHHCSRATQLLQSLLTERPALPSRERQASRGLSASSSSSSHHAGTDATTTTTTNSTRSINGSTAQSKRANLAIQGMTCTSCSQTIQKALQNLPGLKDVRISLIDDSAVVHWEEPPCTLNSITEQIENVGFTVESAQEQHVNNNKNNNSSSNNNNNNGNNNNNNNNNNNGNSENNNQKTKKEDVGPTKATLQISGMTCSMCSQSVTRAVEALEGVRSIHVSLPTDSASVEFLRDVVSIDAIQDAIEDVGYQVDDVHVESPDQTPSSQSPNNGDGSNNDDNNNNTSNGQATDTVDERWQRLSDRQEKKVNERQYAFLGSLIGALPILLFTMVLPRIFPHWNFLQNKTFTLGGRSFLAEGMLLWCLATPVQFMSGWDFYRMSFYNLRAGRAGMDVLVALGTSASYGYACWGLWNNDHESIHFFETAATLICFVLAGKWMQALAVRRTSKALTELMKLQSPTAVRVTARSSNHKIDPDTFNPLQDPYHEETVPIKDVHKGDLVKVIRGSSIPADGRIAYGEMSVDESMVTGESMPVLKTPDSDVLGGTVCVETGDEGSGAVFVKVTGVGSDTALAQIIELVQDAQTRSVPIQSFADSVSAVFVPAVCIISLLTFMTWYALCSSGVVPASWYKDLDESIGTFSLTFGISCLVVSCPCALGLATPTAVMVGSGTGARLGILMKGGEAMEVASKVDSVVLDKTGTLTRGKPSIVDSQVFGSKEIDRQALMWMLGSLEKNSEHPLAEAVVSFAQTELGEDYLENNPFVQPRSFKAHTGRGATGVIDDSTIAVGNRQFAYDMSIQIPGDVEKYMGKLEREGKTAVLVALNGKVYMALGIADRLKSDAAASVLFLTEVMKIDVWMVTGDNRTTANAIGSQLGLPENRIISEALPSAKVSQVRKLQAQDRIVAMVGDGINDSPALAQADVGISLGSGAKIATEASDMVLVRGNVADVCTALHLSHVIFRRIQLNLLFSLVYNCLGIPLAAGAFYPFVQARLPPTVAGAAMALSSISVVLSSLSLRFYKAPQVTSRRRSSTTSWAREIERRRGELMEGLLVNDNLATSELTETTQLIDNRSSYTSNIV